MRIQNNAKFDNFKCVPLGFYKHQPVYQLLNF